MLVVPNSAIGNDQEGDYVLVVEANDVVARRAVVKGPLTSGGCAIRSGLTAADRVIVNGLMKARPGRRRSTPVNAHAAGQAGGRRALPATSPKRLPCSPNSSSSGRSWRMSSPSSSCCWAAWRCSRCPVAQYPPDHAAHGSGHRHLSRRQRQDAGRDGRPAHRAAGQRRREDALHAVHLHLATAATRSPSPSMSAPIWISRRCWSRTASRPPCPSCRRRCSSRAWSPRRNPPPSCRSSP